MDSDNNSDIIDSRDIIERISELEDGETLNENDQEELDILVDLAVQAGDSPDWKYGETLIRDSYFVEYAQQLAEDTEAVNADAMWPNNHIDWEAAANELKLDYFTIDYDGVYYWMRS